MKVLPILIAALVAGSSWTLRESGTQARFRGVSAVSREVAWAGGNGGTIVRTVDGGAHWSRLTVPDATNLDFRDIEAFDDQAATILSIGPGELSRIYRTIDGGSTWTLQHTNRDPKGFLDAIAFWDRDHGLALGDPVDGRYTILTTDDGGRTWSKIPGAGMPEALPGEGAFAASGTCLVTQGESNAWFGTGGGSSARVFRSTDRGRTWTVSNTPIHAGNASSGVFSLGFRDADHGVAVGGDYRLTDDPTGNLAITVDGGRTWKLVEEGRPAGFRSAVVFVPGGRGPTWITVGPAGSDRSTDDGLTWKSLDQAGFHTVSRGSSALWAAGEKGLIGKYPQ